MRYEKGQRVALVCTDVMRPVNLFHAVLSHGSVESPGRQSLAAHVVDWTDQDQTTWPHLA